jgi:hypothetical protein
LTIRDPETGTVCGIADMTFKNDILYGVSTGVFSQSGIDNDVGIFWNYSMQDNKLHILQLFAGLKPEGLAYNIDKDEFCIVFDNGSKNPSQFLVSKGQG